LLARALFLLSPQTPPHCAEEPRHDFEDLVAFAYDELRRLACYFVNMENPGHTLAPTAIVHEAYLRLVGQVELQHTNKQHFIAIASTMIRRVLIDHARKSERVKRGRDWRRVTLSGAATPSSDGSIDLLTLNDGLDRLSELEPRLAQVVEMRFFGGLSIEETAAALGVSKRTVCNDWRYARAWLQRTLDESGAAAAERR
jgi:RNA polymerase sigma factor (TIGR02999 family)